MFLSVWLFPCLKSFPQLGENVLSCNIQLKVLTTLTVFFQDGARERSRSGSSVYFGSTNTGDNIATTGPV